MTAVTPSRLDPSRIMQVGEGFMASKTLLSAIELDLFTQLRSTALTASQIKNRLGLHQRAIPDFPDALLALGMLTRDGEGPEARYANTSETAVFLDKASPTYIGGVLEMCNARLYQFWGDLTEALMTGQPQNEVKHSGRAMFEQLYSDPARLKQFMDAMTGASMSGFHALADTFDFAERRTLCDVGGATGQLSIVLARRHPHLRCITFDLPVVEPLARASIAAAGLTDRVAIASGDFFTNALPQADVITMGMILHDWNLEQKMHLIKAAHTALSPGGALICIEPLIDDARRTEAFALSMSLNMLIEFGDAFGFTGNDYTDWCTQVGFERVDVLPLAGPMTAGIAHKASAR
jgi:2-polyprenyl-3-methyl-5-hydroxy-6-metoxy-1,4-benzoquinol methylase